MKKILVVLSEWGYWGEELVGPLEVLDGKGYETLFATPKGKRPHALPPSMQAGYFDPPLDKVVTIPILGLNGMSILSGVRLRMLWVRKVTGQN